MSKSSRDQTAAAVLPQISTDSQRQTSNDTNRQPRSRTNSNLSRSWGHGALTPSSSQRSERLGGKEDTLPHLLSSLRRNLNSMSVEDICKEVNARVVKLLSLANYTSADLSEDFSYLKIVTKVGSNRAIRQELSTRLSKLKVSELYQKVWRTHFYSVDFTTAEMKSLYSNMIDSLSMMCNISDKSVPLCTSMYNIGLHKDMIGYLASPTLTPPGGVTDHRLKALILGLMNLLYDLVQNVGQSWESLKSSGAVETLQKYRETSDELISCKALLLQAYVITEAENERLNSDEKTFKFLLRVLGTTLQAPDHYSRRHGFSSIELVSALNRLAANDNNKERLVHTGALPLYVRLLENDCSTEEQSAACEGLWTLAFQCKDQILAEPGCLAGLQRLINESKDEKVRQQARGALWILHSRHQRGPARFPSVLELTASMTAAAYDVASANNSTNFNTEPELNTGSTIAKAKSQQSRQLNKAVTGAAVAATAAASKNVAVNIKGTINQQPQQEQQQQQLLDQLHVFISYQWDSKPSVMRLRDKLKQAGYQVWVDVDSMVGSVLEAMAEAVEKAAVVIICLTQKYKESPNCRTEAEYTFRLRKEIIPVRMQPGYTPDGWLGALAGSKLVHDFVGAPSHLGAFSPNNSQRGGGLLACKTTTQAEETFYQALIRDLGDRGKLGEISAPPAERQESSNLSGSDIVDGGREKEEETILNWSSADVQLWLRERHLQNLQAWFKEIDGSLLIEYLAMRREAPETFYSMLHQNKFSLSDILRLSSALNQIYM